MRALILIAGALCLAACGKNDQTDNSQNIDENLTAENIVSNDVTAIDAVTGDAANMAAESDVNDIGNAPANGGNMAAPAKPASKRPAASSKASSKASEKSTAATPATSAGNSAE